MEHPAASKLPFLGTVLAAFATAMVLPEAAWGESAADALEYQKKAAFISSFTRFVEWPARKFTQPDTPFVIGVFGLDAISAHLQEAVQNRQIKGRSVIVRQIVDKEDLHGCHVLFVSRSERDRLPPLFAELRRESVLTIGECDNFLLRGGMINFVVTNGATRFQINTAATERERLAISSKLLQIAVPIDDE